MEPERAPLGKIFNVPFLSLDGTSIEMATLLFLFVIVLSISVVERRRQLIRRVVQVFSFFVFYFVVYSCLGVFGMIRNGLYGLTLLGTAYSESFYWLALPVVIIAVTLLHGPIFCGWICPTGSMQDLSGWLRKRLRLDQPDKLRRHVVLFSLAAAVFLSFLAWVGQRKRLFVEDSSLHWSALLLMICVMAMAGFLDDKPSRKLRLFSLLAIVFTAVSHMVVTSPVHFAFTSRDDPASAITTLVILIAALFVGRAWCRYLCPWGYLMGIMHRFSRLKIVKLPGHCDSCGTCNAVCDVDAIHHGHVQTDTCQFCYKCVDDCPRNGLQVVNTWRLEKLSPMPRRLMNK
jgi:polyferredoxin